MGRVLLVIEDYQELVKYEALLRKLGFDVIGVSNQYSVSEKFISFNPDIVIVSGRGQKVSPLFVATKAVEARNFKGKVVLSFFEDNKPRPDQLLGVKVDGMIEAPIQEARLVEVLARITGTSHEHLSSKLTRTLGDAGGGDEVINVGKIPQEKPRKKTNYGAMFQGEELPPETTTDRAALRLKWSEMDLPAKDPLHEEKKRFVRALFRKKD